MIPNCPFYGCAMYQHGLGAPAPFILLGTGGNQCALIRDRHAPCLMEQNHDVVEWHLCPLVGDLRINVKD